MYLVYEKNYGFNDVDCVEKNKFALFHNKEKALKDMDRRSMRLLEDNPSFSFMEEKSDENCIVIADCPYYDPNEEERGIFIDPEIHICLTEVSASDLNEKDTADLLRRVVEWILQDSSELSEARRILEEMGFTKAEYDALGFPRVSNADLQIEPVITEASCYDISRILTISLDHASFELVVDMMNNGLSNKLGGVTVYRYEYGYMIVAKSCSTEEEWDNWLAGIDPRLHRMLQLAHDNQCGILRLDEDGPVMEGLEIFESEEESDWDEDDYEDDI